MVASPKINSLLELAKLANRLTTPDRANDIKSAQKRLEDAQRALKLAKDPQRARDQADAAKNSLDIATEKLAKAQSRYDLASAKLKDALESQPETGAIAILESELQTAEDRHKRASNKVVKLTEEVRAEKAKLAQSQSLGKSAEEISEIELALNEKIDKLGRARIQLNARKAELDQVSERLSSAKKSVKTPEQIKLLESNKSEALGALQRAQQALKDAEEKHRSALADADSLAIEYTQLEADLAAASADFKAISEETDREKRFRQIEERLERADRSLEIAGEVKDAIDPFLSAEFWWNSISVCSALFVATIFFSPTLTAILQNITKGIKVTVTAVEKADDYIKSTIAPDLGDTPKVGETIAGWIVTSGFGKRTSPCAGCSSFHNGIDLADPRGEKYTVGKQLFLVGLPGTKTELTCWNDPNGGGLVATMKPSSLPGYEVSYLHLSKCLLKPGETKTLTANPVIAAVGSSGVGTGAHLDVRVKKNGKYIPTPRAFAWFALDGRFPDPIVASKRFKP